MGNDSILNKNLKVFRIFLIGKGTVGTSFLNLLRERIDRFKHNHNVDVRLIGLFEFDGALIQEEGLDIGKILKKGKKFRELSSWLQNANPIDFLLKLKPNACIDTTPTNPETGEPAMSHLFKCIELNIDFITSSKGPFYLKYKEIKELALEKNSYVRYEATVASGVPALAIKQSLMGTDILTIRAILNGTSNYILSRMTAENISFSIALKEAQELGYAEADPTLDIEGLDAAGKLVILANEIMGWESSIKDVNIKGITKITPQAIELAKSDGYVIKHLAIAEEGRLLVEPRLIEKDSPLNISGTLNVIELTTKDAGPIILIGRGAGGFEAASALMNDLYNVLKIRNFLK